MLLFLEPFYDCWGAAVVIARRRLPYMTFLSVYMWGAFTLTACALPPFTSVSHSLAGSRIGFRAGVRAPR